MKRVVCVLLIVAITMVGCAGTAPNPIATYLPGDEKKSCSSLKAEVANIDKQILQKQSKKKSKDSGNVLWFISGFFLIVPWFFMDVKGSEEVEVEALQARKDALIVIAADKDCGF